MLLDDIKSLASNIMGNKGTKNLESRINVANVYAQEPPDINRAIAMIISDMNAAASVAKLRKCLKEERLTSNPGKFDFFLSMNTPATPANIATITVT